MLRDYIFIPATFPLTESGKKQLFSEYHGETYFSKPGTKTLLPKHEKERRQTMFFQGDGSQQQAESSSITTEFLS